MKILALAVAGLAAATIGHAYAADGKFNLSQACGSCHALAKSADTSLERVVNRKAPDLWYAGSKFKPEWLVRWLQEPAPIRPVGYPYFNTITKGPEHDIPDPTRQVAHVKLAKADAEAATAELMLLKGPTDLVVSGTFKGDAAGARMGALAFNKLRGCTTCHQGEGGQGGLSGPSLTEAGKRLQNDFIAAYTADPQRFDPHVWMPTLKLNEQDIQRLTAYLTTLGSGEKP
jgi:mono/diheme cytochrome c family protein